MRRAAMLLLVALLVGALPAVAQPQPISMFPAPFVHGGTIYTDDGKATMAIIIGDKAATFDMIGAAMLAMKIGSHLYYTKAPYVDVEDAAKHGITLYYGGFNASVYNQSIEKRTIIDKLYPSPASRVAYYCYSDSTLYYYMNSSTGKAPAPEPAIYKLSGTNVLMPLDDLLNPAEFHYLLGKYVKSIGNSTIVVNTTSKTGFYLQTGFIEFSNTTGDVNIPWLGFKLHVDNIYINSSTTPINHIRMRVINPASGATVAFIDASDSKDTVFPVSAYTMTIVGNVTIAGGKNHKGVPVFYIKADPKNFLPLSSFGVILANITSAEFNNSAVTDEIHDHYGSFGAVARFNTTSYPVSGAWAVWNVNNKAFTVSGNVYAPAYIWSKSVFGWFNGNVNAYFINRTAVIGGNYGGDIYVFNGTYGIGLWKFNETKKIGDYEFLFSSIGNRAVGGGAVTCPLTETIPPTGYKCGYICGNCTGVYRIDIEQKEVPTGVSCPSPISTEKGTTTVTTFFQNSTVYPRIATGVFAGIFDRFESVSGFKGTTQLKIETSGNKTYALDITQPADVDQVFEGEAVFSFVKMPIIYLDSWVFDPVNNKLSENVTDKDLILVGGPAVNTIVKYLNDAKLLNVTFKQVNGVWTLEYAGKTYDLDTVLKILVDQGYLPAPISKDYVYRVEGGNGLGVIEYATSNPFNPGKSILVVAGTDRYGTLAASVALADPTKLASTTAPVFYAAGRGNVPNAVILLGIRPTRVPVPPTVPVLTPVVVAIPAGAAG